MWLMLQQPTPDDFIIGTGKVTTLLMTTHVVTSLSCDLSLSLSLSVSLCLSFSLSISPAPRLSLPPSLPLSHSTQSHTVRDLCRLAFSELGLDYQQYVHTNQQLL